jgi:hypothetical protein
MSGDLPEPLQPLDQARSIYDVLEHIRARPGMWVRQSSLRELDAILFGYGLALDVHGFAEPFDFHPVDGAFPVWLTEKCGWSPAIRWSAAIERNLPDEPPLDAFFRLLDEFLAENAPLG